MSEKVIGSKFNGLLWCNEYNVDSRTYTQNTYISVHKGWNMPILQTVKFVIAETSMQKVTGCMRDRY
jgi:hypothetical protein